MFRFARCKCIALTVALFSGAPVTATAQTVDMSPKAQEAFQKGIIAAREHDWKSAIRYFVDAQKANPKNPQIWFNLGLASAKVPGYELRSTALFRAYLIAEPHAANSPAVRAQIAEEEVAFESKMVKILQLATRVARGLYWDADSSGTKQYAYHVRDVVLPEIAASYNFLGDARGAIDAAQGLSPEDLSFVNGDRDASDYVVSVASTGRFDDAWRLKQTMGFIDYYYERGELAGALRVLQASLPYPQSRIEAGWEEFACAAFDLRNKQFVEYAVPHVPSSWQDRCAPGARATVDRPIELGRNRKLPDSWWGKSRISYLVALGANGVYLDWKSTVDDDVQLDDYIAQRVARLEDTSYWTRYQPSLMIQHPVEDLKSGLVLEIAWRVAGVAEAYRRVRGPLRN